MTLQREKRSTGTRQKQRWTKYFLSQFSSISHQILSQSLQIIHKFKDKIIVLITTMFIVVQNSVFLHAMLINVLGGR